MPSGINVPPQGVICTINAGRLINFCRNCTETMCNTYPSWELITRLPGGHNLVIRCMVTTLSPGGHHLVATLSPGGPHLLTTWYQVVTTLSPGSHHLVTRWSPLCHQLVTTLSPPIRWSPLCHQVITAWSPPGYWVVTTWLPPCHHLDTRWSPPCHQLVTTQLIITSCEDCVA